MRESCPVAARGLWVFAVGILAPACMHVRTDEHADPAAPVTALAPSAPPAPSANAVPSSTAAPTPAGLPWAVAAPPARVPEFQGKPVTLRKGTACKVFRGLPSLTYASNTLIKDACLRIPNGTTIEVREGATLAIVATSELFIGKDVVFDAAGSRGRRGERAEFSTIRRAATTDAEIQALCVEQGNRCPCPTESGALATIRGKAGTPGMPGGNLRLIAGALVSPSRLTGFRIDTSGGLGGPPGDSGTQQCVRGQLRCSSEVCSAGAPSAPAGPRGNVIFSMAGTAAAAARDRLEGALGTLQPEDAMVLGAAADLAASVTEMDAVAIQKGWVRRAGEEVD